MNWEYYFETIEKCYNVELPSTTKNNIKYNCMELDIFTDNESMYKMINQSNFRYYYSKYYYKNKN